MARPAVYVPSLFLALALSVAACGSEEAAAPSTSPLTPAASAPGQKTVTHLLIKYHSAQFGPSVTRSREEALSIIRSILGDVAAGRSFDELVAKFSEDRPGDPTSKPNTNNGRPGSYTWPTPQVRQMMPEFEKAADALPVGKITVDPVETPYGFHIVRRDK